MIMADSSRVGCRRSFAWRRTTTARNTERIAWVLIVFVAGFWLWVGIATAIGQHPGPANVIQHLLVPGGTFAILGVLARRWRTPAAIALIAVGRRYLAASAQEPRTRVARHIVSPSIDTRCDPCGIFRSPATFSPPF